MSRPRAFDTDLAVARAMRLFWRQGYGATSLPQLTEQLDIGSGSLYAAFGSKDGLYARALRRYCDDLVAAYERDLAGAADIRTALRALLLALATAYPEEPERGCLLVSAATERAAHHATVEQVRSALGSVEAVLTEALERARARGELGPGREPAELARFLTTFTQGLHVMGQARADRGFLEAAVSGALRALD